MWKRHWKLAVLGLILVVQTLAIGALWRQVNSLRAELSDSREAAADLESRLEAAGAALQELQAAQDRPEPAARFENPVLHPQSRMLTVDIVAQVPDVHASSLDVGFCRVGEPYSLAWKLDTLSPHADGVTYTGTVTFPLDLDMGLELRLADDTVLYSSATIAPLLPLQMQSGGSGFHYSYERQELSLLDFGVHLMSPSGEETETAGGVFRLYRNGTLIHTIRETADRPMLDVDGTVQDGVTIPCAPGDRVRLTYACSDPFGLRYEFPLYEQKAMRWDDMEECPLSRTPSLAWSE